MLDREIVTACCEIHTKEINKLRSLNVQNLKDKFSGTYIDHWASVDSCVY
jgi:hypothetical protein